MTDLIIKPYLLPQKKHLEQYQRFELTYPQSNDLRSGAKCLHCAVLKPDSNTMNLVWPGETLFFWLNNKSMGFDPRALGEIPWKTLRNSNEFNLCCMEGLEEPAVFLLFMTKKQEILDIVKLISHRNLLKDYESYKLRFLSELKNNKHRVFSINDPISGEKMIYPGRGRFCQHLECFDIANYLGISENRGLEPQLRWKCPVCKKLTMWNELDEDKYVKDIITKIREKQIPVRKYLAFDEDNYWEAFHGNETVLTERKSAARLLFPGNYLSTHQSISFL